MVIFIYIYTFHRHRNMASLFFQKTRGNNINFISIIVKGKEKVEEQRVSKRRS